MLLEEVHGHIADAIDGSLSNTQAAEVILRKANGTTIDRMLTAALMLLREQAEQVAELETEVDELTNSNDHLKDELADLERDLDSLNEKLEAMRARLKEPT